MNFEESFDLRETRLRLSANVAEISHQRGNARNPMSPAMRADYAEAVARIRAERRIRALVITGSEGSFCAGGDIKGMLARQQDGDPEIRSADATRRRLMDGVQALNPLRELEIPVIAAVDGPAYGAGFSLALMADFVLASTRASFCMSFVRLGTVPDLGGLHELPRRVGLTRAREIMLTGRRIDAQEALSLDLVLSLHEPDKLLQDAHAMANRFAAGPREAIALIKGMLQRSFESDYATMTTLEAQAQAICMTTPFHTQAVQEFTSGRPLPFDWDRLQVNPD